MSYDAIVIGAGVNGLAAATGLARSGRKVVVLERRDAAGGQAAPDELAPGFRAAPLSLDAGWLPPPVSRALRLGGLERSIPEITVAVPAEGEWLALSRHASHAAQAIKRFGESDGDRWPAFVDRVHRLADFLAALYVLPPPDVDASTVREMWPLLGLGRKLRGLGKAAMVDLLRVMPMSVQEYLDDQFSAEPLKAAVGAAGVSDLRQGPRSGGTAFVMLHQEVGAARGAIRGRGYWTDRPDALVLALGEAARRAGVVVRTGAEVSSIRVQDDGVTGVVLAGGEEIPARTVLSSADPARTLASLVDPEWLDPEFVLAIRNIKFRGAASRAMYALDALPPFPGLSPEALKGVLTLTPSLERLERAADAAKYGTVSTPPHVELRLPSERWPGLAPPGKHLLVATVQWTPYRLAAGWSAAARDTLLAAVTAEIERVAPGFTSRILHQRLDTPVDLEARYGLTEGALTHGELTLDQILFMRPAPGISRYATPVPGLFLCGSGSHPGPGIEGAPGWLAARAVGRGTS